MNSFACESGAVMVDVTEGNVKQGAARRIEFDVWTIASWFGGAQRKQSEDNAAWKEKRDEEERCLSRLKKMTRWESAAAPFLPVTAGGRDRDYVT